MSVKLDLVFDGCSTDKVGLFTYILRSTISITEETVRQMLNIHEVFDIDFSKFNKQQIEILLSAVTALFHETGNSVPDLNKIREVLTLTLRKIGLSPEPKLIGNLALFIYNNWEELIASQVDRLGDVDEHHMDRLRSVRYVNKPEESSEEIPY